MTKNYAGLLNNMPVIPDVASKILHMAEDGREFSFHDLEETISVDPSLTAKILKVANSALYARQKEITQLSTAITLLGFTSIRSLVILVTGASLFDKLRKFPFYRYFWRRALTTAFFSKELAVFTGKKNVAEQVFVSALLHDIGQVAFFSENPEAYQKLLDRSQGLSDALCDLEKEVFGTTHKEVGSEVLASWNFPDVFCDVAREHGNENITSARKLEVIFVSVADFLVENPQFSRENADSAAPISGYLTHLGLSVHELADWNTTYSSQLEKVKLFQACQSLFSL